MIAPDGLTRCALCDECIDPAEMAHDLHRAWCNGDGCDCDMQVHPACCRTCNPPVIPGQVSLDDIPVASTKALPKMHSGS